MAEYIIREEVLELKQDYGEGQYSMMLIDPVLVKRLPTADVIERSKVDKAIDEITKLRTSTNNMITQEITLANECYKQYVNCFDECLKIIKQNIGE